jgi:hypothetical protein
MSERFREGQNFDGGNWDRIVTSDSERKDLAENKLRELQMQESETLKEKALEPTPLEKELLNDALRGTRDIALQHGGVGRELPNNSAFVVQPELMEQAYGNRKLIGIYNYYYNKLLVQRTGSNLEFANFATHELFHFQGFRSFRPHGEDNTRVYRGGISIYENVPVDTEKKAEVYFDELDEAIVAVLTKRLMQEEIKHNEKLKEEMEAVEEIKEWCLRTIPVINPSADRNELNNDFKELYGFRNWELILKIIRENTQYEKDSPQDIHYRIGKIAGLMGKNPGEKLNFNEIAVYSEYSEYRKRFSDVIEELAEKTEKTNEEIQDMFLKAYFSGRLLDLARFVDGALGKGAFRKIAEGFKKKHEKETEEA